MIKQKSHMKDFMLTYRTLLGLHISECKEIREILLTKSKGKYTGRKSSQVLDHFEQ